ncbi:hypothetical protein [Natrialba asiatica]|uniref:Uncharacterized protein n=1 Tax=Natrialba asiatica (strain ATCC 700177 / DSM 12278 / JCM 9576 / FERM P-10747 / NBRC 102637 / 172P1) TaxID=29540 RepID=M0AL17_NATA1|nr:hypothetical protein [Natrialba asiatica]ELY98622.1 hypothetical protein C481_16887 [Natrialba asiatica DSM 12278]
MHIASSGATDDASDDDSNTGGNANNRLGGLRMWLLLRVDRLALSGAILALIFVVLIGTSQFGFIPHRWIVDSQGSIAFIFSSFIGAIITGTSIVVTINQLVLSQELGAIGDQRSRMEAATSFREETEETISEEISPPEPGAFLYELVDGVQERAGELESAVSESRDEDLQTAIEEYTDDIRQNAQTVKDELEGAQFGTFEVLWGALQYNYSRKIYDARSIQVDHADSLSDEAEENLEDVLSTLRLFAPAREHFKTLYFQWELINLSRVLLYVAISALTVMGVLLMYVNASSFPGVTLGVDNLVWATSVGFVVGLSPFVLFTTYILRIVTVAKRTLAMGPFILRESERDEDLG